MFRKDHGASAAATTGGRGGGGRGNYHHQHDRSGKGPSHDRSNPSGMAIGGGHPRTNNQENNQQPPRFNRQRNQVSDSSRDPWTRNNRDNNGGARHSEGREQMSGGWDAGRQGSEASQQNNKPLDAATVQDSAASTAAAVARVVPGAACNGEGGAVGKKVGGDRASAQEAGGLRNGGVQPLLLGRDLPGRDSREPR